MHLFDRLNKQNVISSCSYIFDDLVNLKVIFVRFDADVDIVSVQFVDMNSANNQVLNINKALTKFVSLKINASQRENNNSQCVNTTFKCKEDFFAGNIISITAKKDYIIEKACTYIEKYMSFQPTEMEYRVEDVTQLWDLNERRQTFRFTMCYICPSLLGVGLQSLAKGQPLVQALQKHNKTTHLPDDPDLQISFELVKEANAFV